MHYPIASFSELKLDSNNIYELSNHIKDILKIDLNKQKSWLYNNGRKDSTHYNFLNNWKEHVSSKLGGFNFRDTSCFLKWNESIMHVSW